MESRFAAMHNTKLPPLFGRGEEIELLSRRWRHAAQGEGQVVMLAGEPGIGKSHIAFALDEQLQSELHVTLRYFCSAHHTNSALFPFISQLERAAAFQRSDTPAEKLSKLDALLAQSTHNAEHVAVLAHLLALPADDRYPLQDLAPHKRKEKTLAALLAQLDGLAARQPVFIIFEDVHWIDPTSLELLATIVEHVPQIDRISGANVRFWHIADIEQHLAVAIDGTAWWVLSAGTVIPIKNAFMRLPAG